ncbi:MULTISPECIES: VOC family protein [unclassified Cryobacterium]|uniref:VOC family protein n=1 Tax=unclassified Cryobacterium TaxID=2649013 RepID=UPI002AB48F79|nr:MULTISPECIES: VOC family protein [unclassified Cryobacterium]MDY7543387.1 VOC family protein [Cryobacterium sp. 5B3]MEA9999706.1 VOC family protein [Cryobacterium sp. RTS3]MEB0264968.1 VOC family protein [Cryobacterium sp. 10I5]MEB0274709.1 VOC family protein [Cryobacterium sp. 5B3]
MNPRLYAYLSYADAPGALRWFSDLGFTIVSRQDGEAGQVVHSEVRLGDVVLMISSNDAAYSISPLIGLSTGRGLYLFVDDVDAYFDRALTAGAMSVFAPEATEWGTRRARVLDPEGNEWSFGTYEPGSAW